MEKELKATNLNPLDSRGEDSTFLLISLHIDVYVVPDASIFSIGDKSCGRKCYDNG